MAISLSYITTSITGVVSSTSYSFSSVSFGSAVTDRLIVVGIAMDSGGTGNNCEPTSVTIGGISAVKLASVRENLSAGLVSAIWAAYVPTGTTGTIVVNTAQNGVGCGIYVYRLTGARITSPSKLEQFSSGDALSGSLTIPVGGAAIGISNNNASSASGSTVTWTNLTKDVQNQPVNVSRMASSASSTTAGSASRQASCTGGTGTLCSAMAVAAFDPMPTLTADTGTFTMSGIAASLKRTHTPLLASPGAFTLTGQNASLKRALKLTAGTGVFTAAQRTNLWRQSQVLNTTWTKTRSTVSSNVITAPDGTLTADKVVEDTTAANSHQLSQAPVSPYFEAGKQYVCSVYAKAGERSKFRMTFPSAAMGGTSTSIGAYFDLVSGIVTNIGSSLDATGIEDVGNGWYRCWITATAIATSGSSDRTVIWLITGGSTVSYDGDGVSGAYFWGMQCEVAQPGQTSPTPYIVTTTVAVTSTDEYANLRVTRRLDAAKGTFTLAGQNAALKRNLKLVADTGSYNISTESKNWVLLSEDLNNVIWSTSSITKTYNVTTDPLGGNTADKISESSTVSAVHYIRQLATTHLSSRQQLTASVYVKAAERGFAQLVMYGGGGTSNGITVRCNLSTGATTWTTIGSGTVDSYGAEDAGNGWWRISVSGQPSTIEGYTSIYIYPGITQTNYNYAGTVGYGVYVWGAQVEVGGSLTSYAPTGINNAQQAKLLVNRRLDAQPGTFTLTGQDVGLRKTVILRAGTGTYTFTGMDAFLNKAAEVNLAPGTIEAVANIMEVLTDVDLEIGVAEVQIHVNAPNVDARPNTFTKVINSRSTDEVFIILVTIDHEGLEVPIRVSNDNLHVLSTGQRGVISNGDEYVYLPFNIVLPNLERDTLPSSKIVIDNIDRAITAALADITEPPEVRIQIALSSDPDIIDYDIQGFKLNTVTYDELQIEGTLSVEYFANEPFPAPRFTPSRFPGLFRGRGSSVGV